MAMSRSRGGSPVTSRPPIKMFPYVASSSPEIMRRSVVFPHRLEDDVLVERHERASIDELGAHAELVVEPARSLQSAIERRAGRQDRQVAPGALDVGLPDRQPVIAGGNALRPEHLDGVVE